MRTKRSATALLLFLAFPALAHAQLSISLLPYSPQPPLGLQLAGSTQLLSFGVYLTCTGYNPISFTDQVTFGVQFAGASKPTASNPSQAPFTLSTFPSTQELFFNLPILVGLQTGSITIQQTGYTPGDDPCRDDPDPDAIPDPPNLSAAFVYDYHGSSVGISDYARIKSSDAVFSPLTGSLSPDCVPRRQGYCPPRYNAEFIQAEGSHAYEVSASWNAYLVGRTGSFPLPLTSIGDETAIAGPLALPANEQWLRDSNGNILGVMQVEVKDSEQFGHQAQFVFGVQTPPAKPTLRVNAGLNTAKLSYVSDAAKTFKIYYGGTSGSYNGTGAGGGPSPISVGAQTSYTITGLGPFRTYYMAVKGFNDQGESVYSNEVVVHPRLIFDLSNEYRVPTTLLAGCLVPTDNLVLWLPLDETAGTSAANMSVFSSYKGVIVGSPKPAPGRVSGALCLNGSTDYVEVPSYPEINFGPHDFSLEAWVKPGPGVTVSVIIDKRDESGFFPFPGVVGYSFFLYKGLLALQLADGFYDNYFSDVMVPNDGNWHHVAVTVQRSSATGIQFYLDGKPMGKTFDPTGHRGLLAATNPLRIGSRSSSVSGLFQGCLDEVQAFQQALSPDEVLSNFQAGPSGTCK